MRAEQKGSEGFYRRVRSMETIRIQQECAQYENKSEGFNRSARSMEIIRIQQQCAQYGNNQKDSTGVRAVYK